MSMVPQCRTVTVHTFRGDRTSAFKQRIFGALDDERNQRLSERRAQEVFAYLVQQKIPPASMDVAAFGETRPIAPNDTPPGRQQNRRVELVVSGESIGTPPPSDPPQ